MSELQTQQEKAKGRRMAESTRNDAAEEEVVGLHPFELTEAAKGLLAASPGEATDEQQVGVIGALFEWQVKNDPVAVAAFNRTDGFIPAEEYAERLRLRRER